MPNKKKNKPNAYFTFMQMRKPHVEKKLGHSMSYEELNHYVGKEWRLMTSEEKAKYAPTKTHIPLDCYGIPLSVHIEEAERKKRLHEEMMQGIKTLVDLHVEGQEMTKLELVVVATVDYVTTEDELVFPAEISLVRATLGAGVDARQYHAILKPPVKWPVGYEATMRTNVAATHRLPFDRRECVGADDFGVVAAELRSFLLQDDGGEELVPVYALSSHRDIARRVLSQAFALGEVKVWSLEELLVQTFVALFPEQAGLYSTVHAYDDIVCSPESPDYHPALGCLWHRENQPNEVNFCSLNMAQRWTFMFLRALRLDTALQLELVPGRHTPGPNHISGTVVRFSAKQDKKNRRRHLSSMRSMTSGSNYSLYSSTEDEGTPSRNGPAQQTGLYESAASGIGNAMELVASSQESKSSWHDFYGAPARVELLSEIDDSPDMSSLSSFPSLGGGSKKTATKAKQFQKKKYPTNASGIPAECNTTAGDTSQGLQNGGNRELVTSLMTDTSKNKQASNRTESDNSDDVTRKHENPVSDKNFISRKPQEIHALCQRYKKIGAAVKKNNVSVESVESALQNTRI